MCKESSALSSLGLVDFAIRLVNSVLNLPSGQVKTFGEFIYRRTVKKIEDSRGDKEII